VALLALRGADESPVDPELVACCALVEELPRQALGASPRRVWEERRRLGLAMRGRPGWVVGHTVSALRRRLVEICRDWAPDVIQLEYLALADLARAPLRPRPPVVLVEHDARPPSSTGAARRWRSLRRDAARAVDTIVAFSDEDAEIIREDAGPTPVVVIAPGLDLPPRASSQGEGHGVLFVGAFRHPPNVEAALRLAHEVQPRVRGRCPAATLTLVGADPPPALAGDGVLVTGGVPDVWPFLDRAAVVVAPVSAGGGVRVKVLEALAAGKAVVASSRAIEGIGVQAGEHLLVADGDEETAAAIVALLEAPELRSRLGASARAWAEAALRWDDRLDRYEELYRHLTRNWTRQAP
jgi:glycosyltransferase involved in cell wall biosynthesis